ncbi:hypothetical protein [Sorangium sp. So ce341]|uniref:hypothetical protein n=1 Tax=Sorangium sp. So ce341 TaxID=3133302 RepID=UPI003F61863D
MPRILDPQLIAFPHKLSRGALLILPSAAPDEKNKKKGQDEEPAPLPGEQQMRLLRFQYNPETITRTRAGAWDARKNQKSDPSGQKPISPAEEKRIASMRGGGLFAKSETIAMKLMFDATEALLRGDAGTDAEKVGILPELAALEMMALAEAPKEPEKGGDASKAKKEAAKAQKLNALHPKELLLVLGDRYFPVIVTSMTINEKRFSPTLVPLRAEVDLQMVILEATEVVGNPPLFAAYKELFEARRRRALEATLPVEAEGKLLNEKGELQHDIVSKALVQTPPDRLDTFDHGEG